MPDASKRAGGRPSGAAPGGAEPPEIALVINERTNMDYAGKLAFGVLGYAEAAGLRVRHARGMPLVFQSDLPGGSYGGAKASGGLGGSRGSGGLVGLVVQGSTEKLLRLGTRLGVPAVNVSSHGAGGALPTVNCDNAAIGRLAAAHLHGCGYRRFLFVGKAARRSAQERARGFAEGLAERGAAGASWLFGPEAAAATTTGMTLDPAAVEARLRPLLPPLGVFAETDILGRQLLRGAVALGLRVPEGCGLLGVDNTSYLCETTTPTLSSVDAHQELVGRRAAALLHRLVLGQGDSAPVTLRVPPRRVVQRGSTDPAATEDAVVREAVRLILRHARDPLQIDEIARTVGVSRRRLEVRFRAARGRSPLAEVHAASIHLARQLLADTDLPVTHVHAECGFRSYAVFHAAFKRHEGVAPGAWRAALREEIDDPPEPPEPPAPHASGGSGSAGPSRPVRP